MCHSMLNIFISERVVCAVLVVDGLLSAWIVTQYSVKITRTSF